MAGCPLKPEVPLKIYLSCTLIKVEFENAVLESIKKFYNILKQDHSRNGVVGRKFLLESASGADVCDKNLLSQLSEFMGARKQTVLDCAKSRNKLDDGQKLLPMLSRLQRKTPDGLGIISVEWKIHAVSFYEQDVISDIQKGHNNVHKV